MIIYLSMILWVILMRILCAGDMRIIPLPSGANAYKVSTSVAFLTMGYLVFWIGMRSGIADTYAYIGGFKSSNPDMSQIPEILASKMKGQAWWISIIAFKAIISDNYHVWLMALAMVMGFSVAYCYKRYSESFFLSVLLFILSGNFTWMLNGMRQFLCVTTLMLATPWLLKGKTVHYMALIAVLSLCHFTVWLMVPIYFVVRQKPWGKITLLSILGAGIACALAIPLAGIVENTIQSTSYAGSTIFAEGDDGVHPIRVIVAAIPAILAWFNRKNIEAENNTLLNICINMSILTALLFTFGVFTSGILMGRLPIYCEVYAAISLPLLIHRMMPSGKRNIILVSCILGYCSFYFILFKNLYYISDITGLVK